MTESDPMDRDRTHQYVVLIVDDDPLVRLVGRASLEAASFEVAEAEGGAQGIESFARIRPDFVLLDVEMPDLSGFEVCEAIRRSEGGRHVPILILTGLDDIESIERAYEVGATDFASKPISWVVLGHRIRYTLRASESFLAARAQRRRLDEAQPQARLGSWEVDLRTGLLTGSNTLREVLGLAGHEHNRYFRGRTKVNNLKHRLSRMSVTHKTIFESSSRRGALAVGGFGGRNP